jgi:hypothetical protein
MKKFSLLEGFKYTDEEIEDFFIDYIDNKGKFGAGLFKLTSGFIDSEKRFFTDVANVGKNSKECKRIEIILEDICTGVYDPNTGRAVTNIDTISKLLDTVKTFYARSGEEVNFIIDTEYDDVKIIFFIIGDNVSNSHFGTQSEIKSLLTELADIIKKRTNFKRVTLKGNNWLDIHPPKKGGFYGYDYYLNNSIRKAADGTLPESESNLPLITWGQKVNQLNYDVKLSGGDNQVVVQLSKR